jgi:hypothetical protein
MHEKVYLVVCDDRHHGVDAEPFRDRALAIKTARGIAWNNASDAGDIQDQPLNRDMIDDGWILYIVYGIEGDKVWVMQRNLQ